MIKAGDVGSLLRLFQSEYFTINMLIHYLSKHFNNEGIQTYLINKLYSFSDEQIINFITPLCHMAIIKDSQELERYLYEKSSKNLALYLKIFWTFNSFGHSLKNDKKRMEKMERIERCCEMSMVNGEIRENQMPVYTEADLYETDSKDYEQLIWKKFQEKDARSNYNTSIMKFANSLIKISLTLKEVTNIEDRNPKLKDFMKKTNVWLNSTRQKFREESNIPKTNRDAYNLFEGMILPFEKKENDEFNSNVVVRVVESECCVFNTRKRVPYKIIFETIDFEDLKYYTPNPQHQNTKTFCASLNKDWEIVDESLITYDILDFQVDDELSKELNKYQGLASFALNVEKDEQKRKSWLFNLIKPNNTLTSLNSPVRRKTKNSSNELSTLEDKNSKEYVILQKKRNFENLFPSKFLNRRNSHELRMEKGKIEKMLKINASRRNSLRQLPIFESIIFLDYLVHDLSLEDVTDPKIHYLRIIKQKLQSAFQQEEEIAPNLFPSPQTKKAHYFGPWGKIWEEEAEIIQSKSPYGHFPSYKLRSCIIKGGDDLRQELIAMQVIEQISKIFKRGKLNLYLRPYEIIVTSVNSGIIEYIPNTVSIDELKKKCPQYKCLADFFKETFVFHFEEAQKNFIESLAGYSLISYLLNVKDRHNGNILIDSNGHLIHIDFGFILNFTPGGITFESAPFKLTSEYVDLMGGKDSNTFLYFKMTMIKGFLELRKHADDIIYFINVLMEESELPCFQGLDLNELKGKFMQNYTDKEVMSDVERLIDISLDNWRTIQYDSFQKMTNGILP